MRSKLLSQVPLDHQLSESSFSLPTPLPVASPDLASSLALKERIGSSYNGSRAVFRMLRLETWGSPLMNLGYFQFRGPFAWINLLASVGEAQHRLVLKSIRLLETQPKQHVLDVACGRGKSSFILHCLHPESEIVGLDLIDHQIQAAQTLYGGSDKLIYVSGDAMALEFPDGSFDRVLCLEAAFHFPDRAKFLREAFRVLRPGGRLVVVDFAWNSDRDRAQRDHPQTQIVRDIWQWDDFASVPEYERMGRAVGFHLTQAYDWTTRVTRPIVTQLICVAALARSALGQRFLRWKNPLYRSFSAADWHDCTISAPAQAHVVKHSKYMAFVFEKF